MTFAASTFSNSTYLLLLHVLSSKVVQTKVDIAAKNFPTEKHIWDKNNCPLKTGKWKEKQKKFSFS